MHTINEIMVNNVVTCPKDGSLLTGHQLMKEKRVRHLPVVDEQGEILGILGQKEVLKEVLAIINDRGAHRLEYYEDRVPVVKIMSEAHTTSPDTSLKNAGEHFLRNRGGCLLVAEDNKLLGIVSSQDFVRLSLDLLRENETLPS